MIKLRGKVEDFWDDEERLPKEGCTHVIVDSLLLSINRELAKMNQINQDIIDQLNRLAIRGTDELDVHVKICVDPSPPQRILGIKKFKESLRIGKNP
ncbi:unnamed protein product [Rhizophagus irregularis]|nr:unnamed protein product [Rhizophagus irregularis]